MEVIVCKTTEDAANLVAKLIAKQVEKDPASVLGMATGRTMEIVYDILAKMYEENKIDFSKVSTFNLDEYVGLDPENEHSYRSYMNKFLFDRVNIDKNKTSVPNGVAPDLEKECQMYEAAINVAGGIDLQLLGIGVSGHIGFNEPLSSLSSITRVKALNEETFAQNGPLFPDPDMMPRRAITMGVQTILNSRKSILLATGESKAEIIAKAVEGPLTSMVTASALQMHRQCVVVVDEAAASKLKMRSYYDWVFKSEPEWAEFQ